MFATPAQSCARGKIQATSNKQQTSSKKWLQTKSKIFLKAMKADTDWISNWWFWNSAYFFDYLTPMFKDSFVAAAKNITDSIRWLSNQKDWTYLDPFDYYNFITPDLSD